MADRARETAAGGVTRRAMVTGSIAAVAGLAGATTAQAEPDSRSVAFALTVAGGTGLKPTAGRAFVIIARQSDLSPNAPEPRDNLQGSEPISVPFFGMDVAMMRPDTPMVLRSGDSVVGAPLAALTDIPPGDYVVQGFFNTYETNRRSDGSVVQVHWPSGDGGDIWHSPGNVYSTPRTVRIDSRTGTVGLTLDKVIGPVDPIPPGGTGQQGNPAESKHVKRMKIRSELLSRFWGRDVYLGADILLPEGYDLPANQHVRYPMELEVGHYAEGGGRPHGFDESLGDDFSRWWVSADAARFISVQVRSENPFYDDSYNVNSANLGPYGDAINTELVPAIDRRFRTIGQRWGRTVTGGSTGGWIAAATLVLYPDLYAGAWAGYPDPLDFRAHQLVNVYSDANAYVIDNPWEVVPRPSARHNTGDTWWTMAQENAYERACASRGRSQGQWDIWQAVFGPQGKDGYPSPIWDKRTGAVDHAVAAYWQAHSELSTIVTARWATLGPKIAGRLHVYVGTEDTYFLNNGVQLFEQKTDQLTSPKPDFQFIYGVGQPHGWQPVSDQEIFTTMADFLARLAPGGTDTSGWRGHEQPPALMLKPGRQVVDGS
ncbi:alpha/beta hydrolase-fold protein [Kutzneria sp. CA-103260]|uniref:alpha/beta hydrolase-fold protein n=1 Tax=Kutzneria sp. CA-103260 TaxID=2802641 RepID=UPI001BAB563A|nr:alpha/beta hydrolase-fold protein [Kutzneria sp. CA-103260]QUQ63952.1 Putative esterase [Kutzneria sp. CA-103260]